MTHQNPASVLFSNIEKLGNRNALFHRTVDGIWQGITWNDFGVRVKCTAAALVKAGLQPRENVAIISRNMPEWTIADYGMQTAGLVSVPLYPTASLQQIEYILKETEAKLIFAGEQEQYDKAVEACKDLKFVEKIVVFEPSVKLSPDVTSVFFSDFLEEGKNSGLEGEVSKRHAVVGPDDIFTIIYTSGTSGEPKGVILKNSSLTFCLQIHQERLDISDRDISLAFLPLSHIFERGWTSIALGTGMTNYYIRNPKEVIDLIREVKPTIMCAVPRFYEKTYAGVWDNIDKSSVIKQKIFRWALKKGEKRVAYEAAGKKVPFLLRLSNKLGEVLVFKKGRAVLGGDIRFMPCAGAALSEDIILFFHAVGINIKYGYGLSETTATVSCFTDGSFKLGSVGKVMPGLGVKIGADNEILVKGPTVMSGYYKKPEATAQVLDQDGWFRTGDAGSIEPDGWLTMTGRIKDIMKTSAGKMIAPQLIETLIGTNRFVEYVAVIGDERPYVTALIAPTMQAVRDYAREKMISARDDEELLKMDVINALFDGIVKEAQKDLAPYEQVKKFTLMHPEFSIQNGELTSTLKLRRKFIYQKYADLIEKMYQA
jgi:long-chain acyl-CoA synthetase